MPRHIIPAMLWLALASAVVSPAVTGPDEVERGCGDQAGVATKHYDPVSTSLPAPVVKTYRALFPGHQLWQVRQTGKGDDAEFELTIFHPQGSGSHHIQVGPAFVSTLINYKLVVKGTGAVIREEAHPIAASAVPKAVKQAVEQWQRPLQGRHFFVDWLAHQEVGAERLYSVYIELNSIEGYRATLKADGTFVKGAKAFENYKPKNP